MTEQEIEKITSSLDNLNKTLTRGVNNMEMLVTIQLMDAVADIETEATDVTSNSLKVRTIMRELRGAERRKRVG